MCTCLCGYVHVSAGTYACQKRALDPLELGLRSEPLGVGAANHIQSLCRTDMRS